MHEPGPQGCQSLGAGAEEEAWGLPVALLLLRTAQNRRKSSLSFLKILAFHFIYLFFGYARWYVGPPPNRDKPSPPVVDAESGHWIARVALERVKHFLEPCYTLGLAPELFQVLSGTCYKSPNEKCDTPILQTENQVVAGSPKVKESGREKPPLCAV